jgi:hypothetical protein
MPENNEKKEQGIGDKRGSQGRFADDKDDKLSHSGKTHGGKSQGGRGLSQAHDKIDEVSRKGGRK